MEDFYRKTSAPRGLRNNNPGNIRHGPSWQGLDMDQTRDSAFCQFKMPEWGIRAIAKVLKTYKVKYGLCTVRGIIDRWAPPVENDTGAYQESVAAKMGVGVDEKIDILEYKHLYAMIRAVIKHENGLDPYDAALVNLGICLSKVCKDY